MPPGPASTKCRVCNFVTCNYEQWITHISTWSHQESLYNTVGHGEAELELPYVRDKVVFVSKIPQSTPVLDVATYFSKYGELSNLIIGGSELPTKDVHPGWEPTKQIILVYCVRESVRKAILENGAKKTWLGGNIIGVRAKFDGPDLWRGPERESPARHSLRNGSIFSFGSHESLSADTASTSSGHTTTDTASTINSHTEPINEYQRLARQVGEDLSEVKLEEQIAAFWKLVGLSSTQLQQRVNIGNELLSILQPSFNECTIFPVGPAFLGCSTEFDTMNLVVDPFGKMNAERAVIFCDNESQEAVGSEIVKLLKGAQYLLKFCKDVQQKWTRISFTKERIQKISFIHKTSGVECNIIVENYLAIQDSRLLKFLTSLDPRLHPILCLVSYFGSAYDLLHSEDEIFKNHALLWMLFEFMSSTKVIPTPNELHYLNKSPLILENVDIGYSEDKTLLSSQTKPPMMNDSTIRTFSIIALLKEFFEYFEKCDLKRFVVCPAVGKLVPVNAFGKVIKKSFPDEMKKRYLFGDNGAPRMENFYVGSPMGLQHPLDLVSNLTRDVTFEEVNRFQNLCSAAKNKLDKILKNECIDLISIFVNLEEASFDRTLASMDVDDDSSSESEHEESKPVVAEPQPAEESSWEMDTEDEENPLDSIGDRSSFMPIKRGKLRVNQSLRNYFEKAMSEIPGAEEISLLDVRKKFQALWLQYIIEFNQKFWSECFGFVLDGTPYEPPDFSNTVGEAFRSYTLKERFASIPTDLDVSTIEFQYSTAKTISDLLYKKKVWKKKFLKSHIRPLWALLTSNAVTKSKEKIDLTCVTKRVPLSSFKKMEFSCKLDITCDLREDKDLPKNDYMATIIYVTLKDVTYKEAGRSLRKKKLRFLISVYESLAMKYCNFRIKQWVGSCADIILKTFDDSYKEEKRQLHRERNGHPRWKKFKRKWNLILKERQEIQDRMMAQSQMVQVDAAAKRQTEREEQEKKNAAMRKKIKFDDDDD